MYKIIRRSELIERLGISKSQSYVMQKKGIIPEPFPLGARSVGWLESDIDKVIETLSNRNNNKEETLQ